MLIKFKKKTVLRKIPKITIIAKITNEANGRSKNNNSSRQTRKGGPTNITKITKITNIAKITSQANGSSKNSKNNKYNNCAKENTENNNYSKNNENNKSSKPYRQILVTDHKR